MTTETMTPDKPAAKARKAAAADRPERAERPDIPQISPAHMNLSEQVMNDWVCVVGAGTHPDDLDLKARPFALIADLLHEGDNVRCMAADKRSIIDVVCVHRSGTTALCRPVKHILIPDFEVSEDDSIPDGFEIRQAKPGEEHTGWLVLRKSDGWIMNKGQAPMTTKREAINYILDHPAVRGETPQSIHRPRLS